MASTTSKQIARLRFVARDPKRAARRGSQILARTAWRGLLLPPRIHFAAALPGAAHAYEARWDRRLRTTPVISAEEHCRRTGMKDIEEVVHCSLCGSDRVQALFEPRNVNKGWHYHVVRCADCSFLYRLPGIKPERLGELYAGRYDKFLTGHYGATRQRRYRLVMDAFDPMFRDGAGRRLLDFGCGAGHFLEVAHERGFDGYGVDLSPDSVEAARRRPSGRHAYVGRPDAIPEIASRTFDVVTMWSVLAHLAEPVEDLTMLRNLLTDDGVLLVLTVNANSLRLKAERDRWNGFTPNHLKFFSPTTLTRALALAGFERPSMPPMYSYEVERGSSGLSERDERRLRRVIDRGNRGNMIRAVAFAGVAAERPQPAGAAASA